MKIRKGDTVLITRGKERGKKGKVIELFPQKEKVLVEGMNVRKKHIKPRRAGEKGQIVAISTPLRLSNVKIVCPKCAKPARIGYRREGDKKYRICKKCWGEV